MSDSTSKQQNAFAAAVAFPNRSDTAVAAELAKHPGQYIRANENVDWQEAVTGAVLSANIIPPPAKTTSCGSIIWVWNGKDYDPKSKNCKPGCPCVPVKPDASMLDMPTGAEITKDC